MDATASSSRLTLEKPRIDGQTPHPHSRGGEHAIRDSMTPLKRSATSESPMWRSCGALPCSEAA